jgi:protein HOOK3
MNLQQAAQEQIIKNLERENALISSAWYDLTSRLQSNHVVLQRRHDVPKSWLNKQRQMVNGKSARLPYVESSI